MTNQIIPLTLSQSLKETGIVKGFAVSKSKVVTNLLIDLNGNYNNKKVVSTVNLKNWSKTHQALKEALVSKNVRDEHVGLILDDLDNNSAKVLEPFNGNGNSNEDNTKSTASENESSAAVTINQVFKAYWICKKKYQNSITMDEWRDQLAQKYDALKNAVNTYFPSGWPSLEATLAISKILNIDGCTLPFALWILGRSGGNKTLSMNMFDPWLFVYLTRKFSPRAFVSHNSSFKSEEELEKVDLLPKIRFKTFLVPELAPIFSVNDDEMKDNLGTITSLLDGNGFPSDSGAQGGRHKYTGNYMFVWVGATASLPYRVIKEFSYLGPKVYTFRLPFYEPTDEEIESYLDSDSQFEPHKVEVQKRLMEYLIWFEMWPEFTEKYTLEAEQSSTLANIKSVKVKWDPDNKSDPRVKKHIAKFARLLGKVRTHVDIWYQTRGGNNDPDQSTGKREYNEYSFQISNPEDPRRCSSCLHNATKGVALSHGRNYAVLEDLQFAVKIMLSSGSYERIATMDLLLSNSSKGKDRYSYESHIGKGANHE